MDVVERLQSHSIKPSVQRMSIMRYLMEHLTHPTVDEIYTSLSPEMPTLSKTTVYNTLKLLSDHGAIQTLTIDERNTCYDADTTPHAHFLCKRCGRIYGNASNASLLRGLYRNRSLYGFQYRRQRRRTSDFGLDSQLRHVRNFQLDLRYGGVPKADASLLLLYGMVSAQQLVRLCSSMVGRGGNRANLCFL